MVNFGYPTEILFQAIGAGEQTPNKKHTPDVYVRVLREMDLPAEAGLGIEDTHIGRKAARVAGLSSVVTVRRTTPDCTTTS